MLPINSILFPTDFSEQASAAFHVACALARDHQADLLILHVQDIPTVAFAEFGAVPPPDQLSRTEVLEKMEEFKPPDESIRSEYLVVDGEPAEEIVHMAQDRHCDLIVMGTHGRTGLSRLLMGSVAEEVVRKAPCPVLTLKAPMPAAELIEPEPVSA